MDFRRSFLPTVAVMIGIVACFTALPALANQGTEDIYQKFDEIGAMRANGQFDEAIAVLQQIIEEHTETEDILRRAYNDLALTIFFQRNAAAGAAERDRLTREIEKQVRNGLTQFPDLQPELGTPPDLKLVYSNLRAEMFGSLIIKTKPDSCMVTVGDEPMGKAPIQIDLFPVGVYSLTVTKSGYKEEVAELHISANSSIEKDVSLSRVHDTMWWMTRVVAPVAVGVGVALALALSGGDEGGEPPPEPLPGPPDPPTQ
jgi:hypothetical protein